MRPRQDAATLKAMSVSRRAVLMLPMLAACSRKTGGYRGYAFIASREEQRLAVVDLEVMAVAKHIPVEGSPSQVLAAASRPAVYALTPDTGTVHEVQFYRLAVARKATVASAAVSMTLAPDEKSILILARQPSALVSLDLDSLRTNWNLPLTEDPVEMALSPDGKSAAITSASGVWLVDVESRHLRGRVMQGDFGPVQFRWDSVLLVAANRGARMLSLIDAPSGRLVTHLPLPIRPDHFCLTEDGGQLFVTGEGMDGVVIMYMKQTEIAETVLAGHAPGAMAVSDSLLFVISPQSGDVTIMDINSRKVIAVVPVGAEPGSAVVTPDNRYALVLNRKSGDVAVLRAATAATKKFRWTLLTLIPVGSEPVSAAVRAV